LRDYIDGLPLDLAVSALPTSKKFRPGLLLHLVLHSRSQKKYAGKATTAAKPTNPDFAKRSLLGVIESLERTIKSVKLPKSVKTEWGEYYTFTNYSDTAGQNKADEVAKLVKLSGAKTVWDMGGNDGRFSRVALEAGASHAICFDIDPIAVEKNYRQVKNDGEAKLLPLLSDLTNPSPALGWAHDERQSLEQRGSEGNLVMALALIHHLAISNNLPFNRVAEYFARLGSQLIIEFVPKTDSKVEILLSTRKDIFDQYDQAIFEREFSKTYDIVQKVKLRDTDRVLYLMKVK
jgi:predicted nicotinamide N-methyase